MALVGAGNDYINKNPPAMLSLGGFLLPVLPDRFEDTLFTILRQPLQLAITLQPELLISPHALTAALADQDPYSV